MLPRQAKYLTWDEVDSIQMGYARRQQQALVGPRLVATQLCNALESFDKNPRFLSAEQYLPLPLVDPPRKEAQRPTAHVPPDDLRKRLEARYGTPIVFESDPLAA